MSNAFHPQLRICILHYLALRYDLSHAYDVNVTCFSTNLINFIVNGRKWLLCIILKINNQGIPIK